MREDETSLREVVKLYSALSLQTNKQSRRKVVPHDSKSDLPLVNYKDNKYFFETQGVFDYKETNLRNVCLFFTRVLNTA